MSSNENQGDFNLEDEEDQQENGQQQGKSKESKIRKKFNNALNGLTRILGGQFLYKPNTLVPNEVQEAVKEMAREEKEKLVKTFKEKCVALIQKKKEHDKHVAKLFAEAKQKEEQNMEGFIKEANDLFKLVKDIYGIEKDYYDTLMSAATGKSAIDTVGAGPAAASSEANK